MPANFTRRRDLFADAGFADTDAALQSVQEDADKLGLAGVTADGVALGTALERAEEPCASLLSAPLRRLVESAPQWLFERGGDLATFLWQARVVRDPQAPLHLGAALFGLACRMWKTGREHETAALVRFIVDAEFDYGDLYTEPGIAHEFFTHREPNPLVWKLLEYIDRRRAEVDEPELASMRVLELGCGIGNDAVGLIGDPRTTSYEGIDISSVALDEHRKRVQPLLDARDDLGHDLIAGDLVSALKTRCETGAPVNVVYSYSSLHYFNSVELAEIFALAHKLLVPDGGLFVFGIKGAGSIWDAQGVPLYRPDVWINFDGQSRWFPTQQALADTVLRYGFEVRLHEIQEHWSYSERGRCDRFHYVVCAPRP